jgi:hypothetical protein
MTYLVNIRLSAKQLASIQELPAHTDHLTPKVGPLIRAVALTAIHQMS